MALIPGLLFVLSAAALSGCMPGASPSVVVLDGTVTGTGSLGGTVSCGLDLSVSMVGTIDLAAGGSGTFRFHYCVRQYDPAVAHAPVYDGTFEIVTGSTTVTGTISGSSQSGNQTPQGFPVHLVLTAAGSATGVLAFDGFVGPGASTIDGTLTGSVVLADDPPASTTVPEDTTSVPADVGVGGAKDGDDQPAASAAAPAATPIEAQADYTG